MDWAVLAGGAGFSVFGERVWGSVGTVRVHDRTPVGGRKTLGICV